jgi:hypothetical protein
MDNLHVWESVYSNTETNDRTATFISRFRVPSGWLYVHVFVRTGLFTRDHISTTFVPDPVGNVQGHP